MTTDIERGGLDVSAAHEPSYYEIALTNRQVVVAFVILLTCLVAAFLSGVWIGRDAAARAQQKLALVAHANGGAGDAADSKDKPEGQALQELKFFNDPRHRPPPASSEHPPAAPTLATLATDTAGKGADSAEADHATHRAAALPTPPHGAQSTAAPRTAGAATAATAASAAHPRQAAQAAAAAPPAGDGSAGEGEPLPPSADVVRPRPLPDGGAAAGSAAASGKRANANAGSGSPAAGAASASPADAAGEVVIQVFSSSDREQADKVREDLVNAGFTAFLSPLAKNGQTMYRVRIGPFANRASAEPVAEKVRKEHKLDTWITPR
jgi:cell division septation protein DedD